MRRILLAPLALALTAALTASACQEGFMHIPPPEPPPEHPDRPLDVPDAGTPFMGEPMGVVAPQSARTIEAIDAAPWHIGRAMVRHDDTLSIADPDNGAIYEMATDTMLLKASTHVGGAPERIVAMPDGTLWVTLRETGELAHLDADRAITKVSTGLVEPYALAAHPTLPVLYVSGLADGKVLAINTDSGELMGSLDGDNAIERPRALAIKDGELMVLSEGIGASTFDLNADGTFDEPTASLNYRNHNPWQFSGMMNRVAVRANQLAFDPATGDALVAHMVAAPGDEESMFNQAFALAFQEVEGDSPFPMGEGGEVGYGGGNFSNNFGVPEHPLEGSVTRLGRLPNPATTQGPVVADFHDIAPNPDSPFANPGTVVLHLMDQPMDIVHHPTLSVAFIANMGSDTVVAFNTSLEDPASSPLGVWEVGHAPKGLALSADASRLFVYEAHAYSVSEIDLSDLHSWTGDQTQIPDKAWHRSSTRTTPFASDPLPADVSRGRRVFTFSRNDELSAKHLFACSSCHFDGREDGVIWAIAEGPRQTPALGGRLQGTEPFNWIGSEAELQDNMSQTIERLGGHGLPLDKLGDLEAFLLHGLKPIPNPHMGLSGRELNPVEQLGKSLFNDPNVGCYACHSGETTTDGRLHNVGTVPHIEMEIATIVRDFTGQGDPMEEPDIRYNTPTLRSLHYTAPYLHDGSAPTLRDAIEMTATTMGHTAHLTSDEMDALVAYLLTL